MLMYIAMLLCGVGVVALDQIVKYLTVAHIPLHGAVPVWNGVFHLTYVQNTGAAFGSFAGGRWLFIGIFCLAIGLYIWNRKKNWIVFSKLENWMLAVICAGGVGNAIDRVITGYVVDMFELDFMNFAVFNVADIFITCGTVVLAVSVLLCGHKKEGEPVNGTHQ